MAYKHNNSNMELTEKSAGSSFTIMGEMSSRLQIMDCENGRGHGKLQQKKQYDRSGHETGGGGHLQVDHPTSFGETFMHLLRGNIGAGVFGMGDAFKNGGIILGPILTVCIGLISVHCQHVLMNCAQSMREIQSSGTTDKNQKTEDPDYAETVELCMLNGPRSFRPWSRSVKFLVNFFICLTQFGFCCIYFVFIGESLQQMFKFYKDSVPVEFGLGVKIVLVLLPILCISMITNLKYLAPLSTIANICMGTGLALTFYFAVQDPLPFEEHRYVGQVDKMPLFFGTAIFAFEGIALVLPLKNAMKKPSQFSRPHGVLNMGMIVVASMYLVMGFVGYLKWGEGVKGSLTLNLPDDDPLAQTVKMMVSFGLLLTYPLQFFVAIQIMWPSIEERFGPLKYPLSTQLLFRALMVLLTFSLSEVIPALDAFISLIGALCSSGLALIFPPFIQFVSAYGSGTRPSGLTILKNTVILSFAIFGLVTGTYESLHQLAIKLAK